MFDSVFTPLIEFKSKPRLTQPTTPLEKELDAIVDIFLDNTTKNISTQINYFCVKNIDLIKKKDKKILSELDKLSFIPSLTSNLFLLWNMGWNKGRTDGKKEVDKLDIKFSNSNITWANFASDEDKNKLKALLNKRADILSYLDSPIAITNDAKRRVTVNPENRREFLEAVSKEEERIKVRIGNLLKNTNAQINEIQSQVLSQNIKPPLDRTPRKQQKTIKEEPGAVQIVAAQGAEQIRTLGMGVPIELQKTTFGATYLKDRTQYIAHNSNKTLIEGFKQPINSFLSKDNNEVAATDLIRELRAAGRKSNFEEISKQFAKQGVIQTLLDRKTSFVLSPTQKEVLGIENKTLTEKELKDLLIITNREIEFLKYSGAQPRLKKIAVTELTHAYNLGRLQYFFQNGVTAVQWTAELEIRGEIRPCKFCESRNGLVVPLAQVLEPPVGVTRSFKGRDMWIIPYHPNCRCYWKPVLDPKSLPGKLTAGQLTTNLAVPVGGFAVTQGLLSAYPMMQAFREQVLKEQQQQITEQYNIGKKVGIAIGSLLIPVAGYFVTKRLSRFFQAKTVVDTVVDAVRNKSQAALNQLKNYGKQQIEEIQNDLSNQAAAEVLKTIAHIQSDEADLTPDQIGVINNLITSNDPDIDVVSVLTASNISPDKIDAAVNIVEAGRKAKIESAAQLEKDTGSLVKIPVNIRDSRVQKSTIDNLELEYIRDNILVSPQSKKIINEYLTRSVSSSPPTIGRIMDEMSDLDESALEQYFNKQKGIITARRNEVLDEVKRQSDTISQSITLKSIRSEQELIPLAQKVSARANYLISRTGASKTTKVLEQDLLVIEKELTSIKKDTQKLDKSLTNLANKIQKTSSAITKDTGIAIEKSKTTKSGVKIKGVNKSNIASIELDRIDVESGLENLISKSKQSFKSLDTISAKIPALKEKLQSVLSENFDMQTEFSQLKVEIDLLLSNTTLSPATKSDLQRLSKQLIGVDIYIEKLSSRMTSVEKTRDNARDLLYAVINKADNLNEAGSSLIKQIKNKGVSLQWLPHQEQFATFTGNLSIQHRLKRLGQILLS